LASIRRVRRRIEVRLDAEERAALLEIVEHLAPLLGTVARTTPRAYDDDALDEEYGRFMRPEVEAARDADIEAMRESLRAGSDTCVLDESQALSWTRNAQPPAPRRRRHPRPSTRTAGTRRPTTPWCGAPSSPCSWPWAGCRSAWWPRSTPTQASTG